MDPTQKINPDGACDADLQDEEVTYLYQNGLISRAEADVYNIIADFNDNSQGGSPCHV